MAVSFEQLMKAIAGQESGGLKDPYSVVNAYGAVGKYQVLKGNVPEWSQAALGYSITWQQFRDSPDLQEKIVRHRLKGYYDQYGARGAASAWYSGNPTLDQSTKKQPGGPSIKEYVDDVIELAGGFSSDGGGGGGGGGGGTTPTVTPMARNESAEQYGFVESMLDAIPELKDLFERAVKDTWTPSKFQAEVRNTTWFKTHSESERQFLIKQYGDPATAGQLWHTNQLRVWNMASQTGASVDWDVVNKFAYGIMALGWSDEQLRAELAKHIALGSTSQGGQAGQVMDQLKEYGFQMGWQFGKEDLQYAAQQVVGGMRSVDQYKAQIRNVAKGIYSQWSDQIEAGQTVMGLASPYFQSMASILELPPGSITLEDPTIKNALQSKDMATGQNRVKQIWEFENDLRSDDRWKKTQNAQNSTMQVAHKVLSDFGFAY